MSLPLLILSDDKHSVEPHPHIVNLGPFAEVCDKKRNKGLKYDRIAKELTWIFHICDPRSPYSRMFENSERIKAVSKAVFQGLDWTPDEVVKKAAKFYREEILTKPALALLHAAQKGAGKLAKLLEDVDLDEKDKNGKRVNDPKMIQVLIERLDKSVQTLQDLEEKVMQEQEVTANIRGGVELTKYNQ